MMLAERSARWILLLHMTGIFLGFAIFLRGFLALKTPINGRASWKDVSLEPNSTSNSSTGQSFPAKFDRLVIVLVDALRADFVLPVGNPDLPRMEFVKKMVSENRTFSFLAKAHPPTVTLPRIKALTTGDVPGFVDVVLNFDSVALQEDNLISQFHNRGRRIVFYGDDTWIRLFPDHFLREEGTTSFFVTDYTEVDNNVTRHLDDELGAGDWEVLILHYLGLDHIGHLAGPYSPLVGPKLNEMDLIIKDIYQQLLEQDGETGRSSLLVVCGDHGMSDQGSHGGASVHEVNTPVVLMSPQWDEGTGMPFTPAEVSQVDLVPTLALLLGVPIPQNSLGSVVLPALHAYPLNLQMSALYVNAQQLSKVFIENVDNHDREPAYLDLQRAVTSHVSWTIRGEKADQAQSVRALYVRALHGMRARLTESLTKYDLHAMGLGIALLLTVFLSIAVSGADFASSSGFNPWSVLTCVVVGAASVALHVAICTGNQASPLLCSSQPLSVLTVLGSFILFTGCLAQICICLPSFSLVKWKEGVRDYSVLCWFLAAGTVGHTLSLLSSSFVEEEHQTWYLLTVTAVLLLGAHLLPQTPNPTPGPGGEGPGLGSENTGQYARASKDRAPQNAWEEEFNQIRQLSELHTQCFSRAKPAQPADVQTKEEDVETKRPVGRVGGVVALVGVLGASRVARAWNQTGDKWAHLPDVGDWLVSPDHQIALSVLAALSLCGVCALRWRRGCTWASSNLLLGGMVGVYMFRAANGALLLPGVYDGTADRGIVEARVVYSIIATMAVHAALHYRSSESEGEQSISNSSHPTEVEPRLPSPSPSRRTCLLVHVQLAWTLLILLLLRPHNVCVVFLLTLMEAGLRHVLLLPRIELPTWAVTLLYSWVGQASFFYQGNSNSISSVDVSAGYVGLEDFAPGVVGSLMCLSTYAGPIFWLISLVRLLSEKVDNATSRKKRWHTVLDEVGVTLVTARALPLAVYTCLTTLQRYHLFVWTVFSPKLLYEGMHTVVVTSALIALQFLYRL